MIAPILTLSYTGTFGYIGILSERTLLIDTLRYKRLLKPT